MTAPSVVGSAFSLRLVRAHVWRAGLVWLAVHVFLALGTGEPGPLGARSTIITAVTAAAIAYVDSRRRREAGFLGNLGVSWTIPPIVAAVAITVLEITTTIVFVLIRS